MGQGSPHLLHALSEDGVAAATMVLTMVEVAVSAAGGMGWEDDWFSCCRGFEF